MSGDVTDEKGKFLWYRYFSSKVMLPFFCMVAFCILIGLGHLPALEDKQWIGGILLAFGGLLPVGEAIQAGLIAIGKKGS